MAAGVVIAVIAAGMIHMSRIPELREFREFRDAPAPTITKAKFDHVLTGMSYEQVCKIMGEAGEELSRTNVGGFTTVMFVWKNPGGSNMNAVFQGNKLISKAQVGLH